MISFKVRGLQSLQAQLAGLGAELGVKTLAAAARKAFKPVLDDAKSGVPVDTGALRESLRISVKKPKKGDAVVRVGIRIAPVKGDDDGVPPARRWHFIELGTAKLAAHPFLRPALDGQAPAVLEALKTELAKGIARALRRKAKADAKSAFQAQVWGATL